MDWEKCPAVEGPTVTPTLIGAGTFAQQFIISLGTVEHAVTHVVRVHAYPGTPAAVEPWTRVAVARCLVFVQRAVKHAVTAHEDRQTQFVTPEVCLWAEDGSAVRLCVAKRLHEKSSQSIERY